MRPTKPGELKAMQSANAAQRYEYFVKRVVDSASVYGLWCDGWAMVASDAGTPALPLWPATEFAQFFAVDEWAEHEPRAIGLDSLIDEVVPDAVARRLVFAIFPVDSGAGVLREPRQLADDLRNELSRYL